MFGFRKNNRQAPPPIFTSKLGVEMLETRENPANYYWDPLSISNLNSTYAPNWVDADGDRGGSIQQNGQPVPGPTSNDTLIFGAVVGGLPNYSNPTPVGGGGVGTTGGTGVNILDCNLFSVPYTGTQLGTLNTHTDYFGWTILSGYTGTVKLQQSSSVGYYTMQGGNLDQIPISGGTNEVTVNVLLNWTNGTINTNAVPGKLTINEGASGWIEPVGGGTVSTNNTLTVDGDEEDEIGASLTQAGGTLSFVSAGRQLLINAFAEFVMTSLIPTATQAPPASPPPMATIEFSGPAQPDPDRGGDVIIEDRGFIKVHRSDTLDVQTPAAKILGSLYSEGNLLLNKFTTLQITKTANNIYTYKQTGENSKTILSQGAILESTSQNIDLGGGQLLGYYTAAGQESSIKVPSNNKVIFNDGLNIKISMTFSLYPTVDPTTIKIGDIKISGDLDWKSATFHTYSEKKNGMTTGDRIIVTGTTDFIGTPVVKVYWSSVNIVPVGEEWVYFDTGSIGQNEMTKPDVQIGGVWQSSTNPNNLTFTDVVTNNNRRYSIKRTA